MAQKSDDFLDNEVEKALRRALKIINKVSDTDINKATRLMAATNLVEMLVSIDLSAYEDDSEQN